MVKTTDKGERRFLTVPQLAEYLGISRAAAYNLIHIAGFPALWVGARVIVPVDRLERWVDERIGRGRDGEGARA